jgi:hypothetical protein
MELRHQRCLSWLNLFPAQRSYEQASGSSEHHVKTTQAHCAGPPARRSDNALLISIARYAIASRHFSYASFCDEAALGSE